MQPSYRSTQRCVPSVYWSQEASQLLNSGETPLLWGTRCRQMLLPNSRGGRLRAIEAVAERPPFDRVQQRPRCAFDRFGIFRARGRRLKPRPPAGDATMTGCGFIKLYDWICKEPFCASVELGLHSPRFRGIFICCRCCAGIRNHVHGTQRGENEIGTIWPFRPGAARHHEKKWNYRFAKPFYGYSGHWPPVF